MAFTTGGTINWTSNTATSMGTFETGWCDVGDFSDVGAFSDVAITIDGDVGINGTIKSAEMSELERKVEELEKKLAKEGGKMRSIYKVYVVDPRKLGKLLSETTVIAETEEQALLKAGVAQVAAEAGLELERVDTYVDEIGSFIRPRKETQRVKMIKDEEEE